MAETTLYIVTLGVIGCIGYFASRTFWGYMAINYDPVVKDRIVSDEVGNYLVNFAKEADQTWANRDTAAFNAVMDDMRTALKKKNLTTAERTVLIEMYNRFLLVGKCKTAEGATILDQTPELRNQINQILAVDFDPSDRENGPSVEEHSAKLKSFLKYFEHIPDVIPELIN